MIEITTTKNNPDNISWSIIPFRENTIMVNVIAEISDVIRIVLFDNFGTTNWCSDHYIGVGQNNISLELPDFSAPLFLEISTGKSLFQDKFLPRFQN